MIRSQLHLIGQPVRSLQTMLRTISFAYPFLPRLTPDGIFGERTLEAVMLFQREFFPPATEHNIKWIQHLNHRPETGTLDQESWNTLSRLYTMFVTSAQSPWTTRPELFMP